MKPLSRREVESQVLFTILAVAVGLIAGVGALTLTDSRDTDEHPDAVAETAA